MRQHQQNKSPSKLDNIAGWHAAGRVNLTIYQNCQINPKRNKRNLLVSDSRSINSNYVNTMVSWINWVTEILKIVLNGPKTKINKGNWLRNECVSCESVFVEYIVHLDVVLQADSTFYMASKEAKNIECFRK